MPTLSQLGLDPEDSNATLDTLGAGAAALSQPAYLNTIDNILAAEKNARRDVFGSPAGLPVQSTDLPQPGPAMAGRQTWFNPKPYSFTDPSGNVWLDTGARNLREGYHASGLPITTPGFATVGRQGLGQWHLVTLPDGRQYVAQKTDIGPPGVVDLNAALASQAYPQGPRSVASGRTTVQLLGSELPYGTQPGPVGGGGWQETVAADQGTGGVSYTPAGKAARGATTDPAELQPQADNQTPGFLTRFLRALGNQPVPKMVVPTVPQAAPAGLPLRFTPVGRGGRVGAVSSALARDIYGREPL